MSQTKSETRKLAEKIQKQTGKSLVAINLAAMRLVEMGLFETRIEALQYMAEA